MKLIDSLSLCLLLSALSLPTVLSANAGADATLVNTLAKSHITSPKIVGSGRMTYLLWDIYDAILLTDSGSYLAEQPFALKLDYLREFEGKEIAKRSVKEMQRQGELDAKTSARWRTLMENIFPDVKKGDFILGVADKQKYSHFYSQSGWLGSIEEPQFTQRFFNIWLGEDTSEPEFRLQLLGETP